MQSWSELKSSSRFSAGSSGKPRVVSRPWPTPPRGLRLRVPRLSGRSRHLAEDVLDHDDLLTVVGERPPALAPTMLGLAVGLAGPRGPLRGLRLRRLVSPQAWKSDDPRDGDDLVESDGEVKAVLRIAKRPASELNLGNRERERRELVSEWAFWVVDDCDWF